MAAKACSDSDFVALFEQFGPHKTADKLGVFVRSVYSRRSNLEKKIGRQITGPEHRSQTRHNVAHPGRINLEVKDGIVISGGDFHYWPGPPSLMHRAFVKLIGELNPVAIVLNGDVIDAASVSRHPPLGWEKMPTLAEEIEVAQERLHEIATATKKRGVRKIWCAGNHDSRLETRIATVAPELAKLHGVHLKDHFALWEPTWSVCVNDGMDSVIPLVIKHRFKGGNFAPYNNALHAGTHMATGHLHSAKVIAHTDYRGTRFGVDLGCVADPNARTFLYAEDNPKNWREAFGVFTFRGHQMMQPELVLKWDENSVQFRGEVIKV